MLDLLDSFHRLARSGRLGRPVFLRCQVTAPPEHVVAAMAELLAAAAPLFEDAPVSLHVQGDAAAGALHAVLLFRSGPCVLIHTGPGEIAVDGMLLGNHGAAYGPGPPARYGPEDGPAPREAPAGRSGAWASRIRRSLSERRPLVLEGEGDV